jgi:hypothetical protein
LERRIARAEAIGSVWARLRFILNSRDLEEAAVPRQWQRRSFAMYPEANGGYGIALIVSLTVNDETVLALWMGSGPLPSAADLQAGSQYYNRASGHIR